MFIFYFCVIPSLISPWEQCFRRLDRFPLYFLCDLTFADVILSSQIEKRSFSLRFVSKRWKWLCEADGKAINYQEVVLLTFVRRKLKKWIEIELCENIIRFTVIKLWCENLCLKWLRFRLRERSTFVITTFVSFWKKMFIFHLRNHRHSQALPIHFNINESTSK